MKRILGLAFFVLLAACGSRTIPLVINVPTGITGQTEALEVYVVDACPVDITRPPSTSRAMSAWRRGEPTPSLPGVLPARFGVLVLARDSDCAVVGARCVMATRDDSRVVVELLAAVGPMCATGGCNGGLCTGTETPDARVSPDAPVDAGSDAGSDASMDAALDARMVTSEARCDCVDDDLDSRVDEGCASTGGDVIWQSTFDGPGDQHFRSLVMGGDGRLYTNGWMGNNARAMCGATSMEALPEVDPISARTWTLGFNATSGVCETVLQHPDDRAAPFASVWRGDRGVWMYVPGALTEIVGAAPRGASRIELMPGADFNAGHVRRLGTPSRILLSYHLDLMRFPRGSIAGVGGLSEPNKGSMLAVAELTSDVPTVIAASSTNYNGLAAWMSDGRVVAIVPNNPAGVGACAATGASRVELRQASSLDCMRAFGTDFVTEGAELQTYVIGNTLWVIRSVSRHIAVRAIDLSTDDATTRQLDLADLPGDYSPSVMLAAAPDGTLFIGTSSSAGGYLMRLRADTRSITVVGQRWMPGQVIGLDVGTDNNVYVMSSVDGEAALCPRGGVVPPPVVPVGAARLLTALDFGL